MRTKTFENSKTKTRNFNSLNFFELNEFSKNENGDDPIILTLIKSKTPIIKNAFYRALLMTDAGINTNRIQ